MVQRLLVMTVLLGGLGSSGCVQHCVDRSAPSIFAAEACGHCGGGGCGHCTGHPLAHLHRAITCGSACGDIYWDEWLSDPPDCCDPCDADGHWIGPGCCPVSPFQWANFWGLRNRHAGKGCGGCGQLGCGSCGVPGGKGYGPLHQDTLYGPSHELLPEGVVIEGPAIDRRFDEPGRQAPPAGDPQAAGAQDGNPQGEGATSDSSLEPADPPPTP